MDEFADALKALKSAFEKVASSLVAFWERNKDLIRALVAAERGARAKAAWEQASRTARVLSRHPDLNAMDGYLDRWYPGVISLC